MIALLLLLAADADAARTAEERAFAAINDARYCDAANAFQDAYDADKKIDFLLNAAKAAARAGDLVLALDLTDHARIDAPATRTDEIGNEYTRIADEIKGGGGGKKCPARVATTPTPVTEPAPPVPPPVTVPPPAPPPAAPAPSAPNPLVLYGGGATAALGAVGAIGLFSWAGVMESELTTTGGKVKPDIKQADIDRGWPVVGGGVACVIVAGVGATVLLVGLSGS